MKIFGYTFFMILCLSLSACKNTNKSKSNELDQFLDNSAHYFITNTYKSGKFRYRFNLNPDVKVSASYNVLRHAGALYAMGTYYEMNPNEELYYTLLNSAAYLRDKTIKPLKSSGNKKALWSESWLNKSDVERQVKSGACGIGLVGLITVHHVAPKFTPIKDLQAIAETILFMQRNDGSLYSKYYPAKGFDKEWISLYYPGECALGLLMLYEIDGNTRWLHAAEDILAFLCDSRVEADKVPADHWALLASAKLFELSKKNGFKIRTKDLLYHTRQICNEIINGQRLDDSSDAEYGGLTTSLSTTATSCRLEGILAAMTYLPENDPLRSKIMIAADLAITQLLNAQIKDGENRGAMPRSVRKKEGASLSVKSFNKRAAEVRIDYVQHAMSAVQQYKRLISE